MLADVAQKIDQPLRHEPLGVVEHERPHLLRVEVEQPAHLVALAVQVLADLLFREERPLVALAARVADQPGAPAHQHDGPVAGQLEMPQQHQRHQVAELQRGRRGVEAAVHRAAAAREVRAQLRCRLVDEPAPLEFGEHVRHGAES